MPGVSKEEYQRRLNVALRLVDVVALDQLPGDSFRVEFNRLAQVLADETGCHFRSARGHIAKACRLKRHPNYTGEGGYKSAMAAGWGGPRPGAGRPEKEEDQHGSAIAND